MNIFWLSDLNVTEEELRTLQNNWRAWDGLSEREKMIIRAAKRGGCVCILSTYGTFGKTSSTETVYSGHVYRLHPDLNMNYMFQNYSSLDDLVVSNWDMSSAEKLPDPHAPYLTTVDGVEVWACPVYVEDGLMQYYRPTWPKGHYVACAANFENFRGVQTESHVHWDLSSALHSHHRYGKKILCVYFAKEVEDER